MQGLFRGEYDGPQAEFKTAQWRSEVTDLESDGAATSTDIGVKLDYAYALHRSNQNPKAIAVYQQILSADPNNYEALCSQATVLHLARQYPQAIESLKKAIALKPGFRAHAEEFHLALLEYLAKSEKDYPYAQANLFLPQLTPIWKNRKGVDENFSTVEFPVDVTPRGLAELVRQFPQNGDTWMALGMALEHDEDFSMAAKAYDRALENGTAHSKELRKYMATFREFGRSQDPGRLAGRRFVQLLGALVGLFILYRLYIIAARVINDVTGARAAKEEAARRKRLRNKDPDSPL